MAPHHQIVGTLSHQFSSPYYRAIVQIVQTVSEQYGPHWRKTPRQIVATLSHQFTAASFTRHFLSVIYTSFKSNLFDIYL
jgi:hypothetical protein